MRCAIWYHLHNLKKVKNTHRGVLILANRTTRHVSVLKTLFHFLPTKKALQAMNCVILFSSLLHQSKDKDVSMSLLSTHSENFEAI